MKQLNIKPDGHMIKGGVISYALDPSGTVDFSLKVTAHYLFSDHQIEQSGKYSVNPDYLFSRKIKINEIFELGKLRMIISDVGQKLATATVSIEGLGNGIATISLAGELIELMSITAEGSIVGQKVMLDAR